MSSFANPQAAPSSPRVVDEGASVGIARSAHANSRSDAELVEHTLAGDRDAFTEIVTRYEGAIFARMMRLCGNREDAEDMTQEAFLRAFRALASYNPKRPFAPWLATIARNAALNTLSRRRQHARIDDISAEPATPERHGPLHVATLSELKAQLDAATNHLSPDAAEIFRQRYDEDLSLAEISESSGKSENSIAVILHRARLEIRRILLERSPRR